MNNNTVSFAYNVVSSFELIILRMNLLYGISKQIIQRHYYFNETIIVKIMILQMLPLIYLIINSIDKLLLFYFLKNIFKPYQKTPFLK